MFALALGVAIAAAAAPAGAVNVQIDQGAVMDLGQAAGSVVVGNPAIADVSLINPRRVAIFGRSYGLTNLIVTDRLGRTILDQQINVAPAATGRVSVYRGALVSNFACSPRCERTPMPGEEKATAYEPYSAAFKDYGERTKSEATAPGSN